jgi:hypothetical protein
MRKYLYCIVILGVFISASVCYAETKAGAKKVIEQWLTLAQQKKWEDMVEITQLTWRESKTKQKMIDYIQGTYGFYEIKSWKYISQEEAPALVNFKYQIETQHGTRFMEANVIVESAPYTPDLINGKWGVNPISAILRNELSSN